VWSNNQNKVNQMIIAALISQYNFSLTGVVSHDAAGGDHEQNDRFRLFTESQTLNAFVSIVL
jgi:hypothetical protein